MIHHVHVLAAALLSVVCGHQNTLPGVPQPQQVHHQQHVQQQQVHQQQQQQVHQQNQQQHYQSSFGSHDAVHDKDHIQAHLDDMAKVDVSQLTPEQMQFHYFKLHDYNNDNRLDGIEIYKAITHIHATTGNTPDAPPPSYSEEEIEKMIDQVLNDGDLNKDGFIDYKEFQTQQRNTRDAYEKNKNRQET